MQSLHTTCVSLLHVEKPLFDPSVPLPYPPAPFRYPLSDEIAPRSGIVAAAAPSFVVHHSDAFAGTLAHFDRVIHNAQHGQLDVDEAPSTALTRTLLVSSAPSDTSMRAARIAYLDRALERHAQPVLPSRPAPELPTWLRDSDKASSRAKDLTIHVHPPENSYHAQHQLPPQVQVTPATDDVVAMTVVSPTPTAAQRIGLCRRQFCLLTQHSFI